MGPDCGTAVVGGVGLGFANVVRPGPVGLVAASGTGAQQMLSLLDAAGVGVSHCLGVGGRDLSAAVGGPLDPRRRWPPSTPTPTPSLLVVVSKPPAPAVAEAVRAYAASPVHSRWCSPLLGEGQPDLTAGAEKVLAARGETVPARGPRGARGPAPVPAGRAAGAVLRRHALRRGDGHRRRDAGRPCARTSRCDPSGRCRPTCSPPATSMIDFGDDALTVGRAHPMIDPTLRLERIAAVVASDEPALLLLDVVLGYGADPDPAAALAGVRPAQAQSARCPSCRLSAPRATRRAWSRQADALGQRRCRRLPRPTRPPRAARTPVEPARSLLQ